MDIKTKDLNICVMESIRIQVQFYVRYFTNYFLTSLENCLVVFFVDSNFRRRSQYLCSQTYVASHQDYQA